MLVPEIAAREAALVDIVDAGTARRLHGAQYGDKAPMLVGAKTGTGDNRKKYFARGGQLVREEVVNRTATVVFFIGDAFFGNLTVYVPGPPPPISGLPAPARAAPGAMAPALQPLLDTDAVQTAAAKTPGGRVRPERTGRSAGQAPAQALRMFEKSSVQGRASGRPCRRVHRGSAPAASDARHAAREQSIWTRCGLRELGAW